MMNRDEEDSMMDRSGSGEVLDCGVVRDLLPLKLLDLLPSERAGSVEAHLVECSECREESDLLLRLQLVRSEPPAELERRILASLTKGRRAGRRIWGWGVSAAAAVVALALGLGIGFDRAPSNEEIWALALQPEATTEWVGDDGMVAGAPLLYALPDEVLREILEELQQ